MQILEFEADAGELHALTMPEEGDAQLWVLRPSMPALVMGSAQREPDFDADALRRDHVSLVPRRSGGGAVFIDPSSVVWIDVLAPRGSRYWSDDLGETFVQVGEAWQRALRGLGSDTELVRSAPDRTADARLVCWAGLGWGELTLGGVKVVGLSQRRTRWGARIQGMAVLDGGAARAVSWLADVDPATQRRIEERIGSVIVPVDRDALETAVVHELTSG